MIVNTSTLGQMPRYAANVEVRRMGTPRARPCMCAKRSTLGCGNCPNALGDYALPEDLGSWLSSAFKKVTGQKLSNVVGAAVGNVPIVGGILQSVVGGGNSGGSGSGSTQPTQGSTGTVPGTVPGTGYAVNDIFSGVERIISAARGETAYTTAAQAAQAAAQAAQRQQAQTAAQGDTMKTVAIVGGIAGAALLIGLIATRK